MKALKNFLNESRGSELTIHVPNASVMALYLMELEGQISDGKYENSRPYGHWKWINDVKDIVIDNEIGISSGQSWNTRFGYGTGNLKYNLDDFVTKYINKWRKTNDTSYIWATRLIGYGKFGRIYPNITYKELRDNYKHGSIRYFLEDLQIAVEQGETDPDALYDKITNFSEKDWRKNYWEQSKEYITKDFIKQFANLKYDIKELKEDLKFLKEAVNTKL